MISRVCGAVKSAGLWLQEKSLLLLGVAVVGLLAVSGVTPEAFAQTGVTVPEFISASDVSGLQSSFTAVIKPIVLCILGIVIGIAVFRYAYSLFRSMGR